MEQHAKFYGLIPRFIVMLWMWPLRPPWQRSIWLKCHVVHKLNVWVGERLRLRYWCLQVDPQGQGQCSWGGYFLDIWKAPRVVEQREKVPAGIMGVYLSLQDAVPFMLRALTEWQHWRAQRQNISKVQKAVLIQRMMMDTGRREVSRWGSKQLLKLQG